MEELVKELEELSNNVVRFAEKTKEIDEIKASIEGLKEEIVKIKTIGIITEERTRDSAKKEFGSYIKKAVTTGTSGASYVLPEEILAEVQDMINSYGVIGKISRNIPMASKTLKIPVAGSVSVYYPDEAVDIPESDSIFGAGLTLTARKQAAFVQISREMMEWGEIQLANYVSELLARDMAAEEDKQALLGTGVPFTGIGYNQNVPAVIGNSTGYAWIDSEQIINGLSLIDGDYNTQDVVLVMSSAVFFNILSRQKKVPGSSGGYQVEIPVTINPPTVAGYRVFLSKVMPASTNGAGLPYIVAGNFGAGHFRGVGQEITVEISRDYDFRKDVISIKATRLHSVGNVIPKAFVRWLSASGV